MVHSSDLSHASPPNLSSTLKIHYMEYSLPTNLWSTLQIYHMLHRLISRPLLRSTKEGQLQLLDFGKETAILGPLV